MNQSPLLEDPPQSPHDSGGDKFCVLIFKLHMRMHYTKIGSLEK
jgi:hypothetical protein